MTRRPVFETPAERAAAVQEEAMGKQAKNMAKAEEATGAKAPVAPLGPPSAAAAAVASKGRTFTLKQIFAFASDAAQADKLKIGDPNAARWAAPFAPIPIVDSETGVEYPSVEHYIAGMKYKLATDKPDLAPRLFGKEGSIRQEFARQRMTETKQGTQALTEARENELLLMERAMILEESGPKGLKRHKATLNPAVWATSLDGVLEYAYKQRLAKDAQLQKILAAVKAQKLYMLYTGKGIPELAGRRTAEGLIDGDNRLGELLMRLAP